MNKDQLYENYIKENKNTFVTFDGVELQGTTTLLIFYGYDTDGQEIKIVQDLSKHNLGKNRMIFSSEELTIKEFNIDEYTYAQIYMKDNRGNFVDIYDML